MRSVQDLVKVKEAATTPSQQHLSASSVFPGRTLQMTDLRHRKGYTSLHITIGYDEKFR
jgi:hypothetical protein